MMQQWNHNEISSVALCLLLFSFFFYCAGVIIVKGKDLKCNLEKVHAFVREVARHFGLDRFAHFGFWNGKTGEKLVVLENFHMSRDKVTCE